MLARAGWCIEQPAEQPARAIVDARLSAPAGMQAEVNRGRGVRPL